VSQNRSSQRHVGKVVDLEEAPADVLSCELTERMPQLGQRPVAAGRLEGEPQVVAPALARGGPAAAQSPQA